MWNITQLTLANSSISGIVYVYDIAAAQVARSTNKLLFKGDAN
jgi:hypothetical protein